MLLLFEKPREIIDKSHYDRKKLSLGYTTNGTENELASVISRDAEAEAVTWVSRFRIRGWYSYY